MATAEGDDAEASEARASLAHATIQLEQLQVAALMSGPNDADGAELRIAVGAGGDDAEDWARMLLRMYSRWGATYEQSSDAGAGASRNDAKTVGAGAGARAAGDGAHTSTVAGGRLVVPSAYAFGWLRHEEGVHRLVRHLRRRVEAPHLVRSRAGGTASTRRDWERQGQRRQWCWRWRLGRVRARRSFATWDLLVETMVEWARGQHGTVRASRAAYTRSIRYQRALPGTAIAAPEFAAG